MNGPITQLRLGGGAILRSIDQHERHEMTGNELPPILRLKGLKLIEMGKDQHGISYLKFAVNRRPVGEPRVREVTIYMVTTDFVEWSFTYSIYDASTRTVLTYRGKHGDPEKDRRISVDGA